MDLRAVEYFQQIVTPRLELVMKCAEARGLGTGLLKFGLHQSELLTEHVEPLIRAAKLASHLFNGLRGDVQLLARLDSDPYVAKPTPLERVGRQNQ